VLTPVQRRTTKATPPAVPATSKPAAKPAAKPVGKSALGTQAKAKDTPALARKESSLDETASARSTPQSSAAAGTLKRSDSKSGAKKNPTAGHLFKSFAKAKPKAEAAGNSQEPTPAPTNDGGYTKRTLVLVADSSRTHARHVRR
jgi:DNA polymerase delta subunit 3